MDDEQVAFYKVNLREIEEIGWENEGRRGFSRAISEALGRKPSSTDVMERHPFDVEVLRVPPGATPYRYHSHSAQWEYYQVIAGYGTVRHDRGRSEVEIGDCFLFKPGQAHQFTNDSTSESDLVILVGADNPIGESYHYPDQAMWIVNSPESRYVIQHPERTERRD